MLYHTSSGVVEYDPKKCSEVGIVRGGKKTPSHSTSCNNCIYCVYRTSRYHCIHDHGDEIIFGKDPVCKNFIKSKLPALHDKNPVQPRVMGKQWGEEVGK